MMTDPIADMLTRIRNAITVERPHVDIPSSKVKRGLASEKATFGTGKRWNPSRPGSFAWS